VKVRKGERGHGFETQARKGSKESLLLGYKHKNARLREAVCRICLYSVRFKWEDSGPGGR
jgi:hypothetical protein